MDAPDEGSLVSKKICSKMLKIKNIKRISVLKLHINPNFRSEIDEPMRIDALGEGSVQLEKIQ